MGREARRNRSAQKAACCNHVRERDWGPLRASERDELRALRKAHLERSLGVQSGIVIATEQQARELERVRVLSYGFRSPETKGRETVSRANALQRIITVDLEAE